MALEQPKLIIKDSMYSYLMLNLITAINHIYHVSSNKNPL